MESFKKLESILAKAKYKQIKSQVEDKVASWQWASGPFYDLVPFDCERRSLKRGKSYNQEPKSKKGAYQYGLDAKGEVIVVRIYQQNDEHFKEHFLSRAEGEVTGYLFDAGQPKTILTVSLQEIKNGMPVGTYGVSSTGNRFSEKYEYDHGLLSKIDVHSQNKLGGYEVNSQYEIIRDNLGEVAEIYWIQSNGEKKPIYQAAPQASASSLADQVEKILLEIIPKKISLYKLTEPIYCAAIVYGYDPSVAMPPTIALGLESERQHWATKYPESCREFMWNPAEFSLYGLPELSLAEKEWKSLFDQYNLWLQQQNKSRSPRELLVDVAKKLQKQDWRKIAPSTDDFVVYAVDDELVDLMRNLKKTLPRSLLERFRGKGWL